MRRSAIAALNFPVKSSRAIGACYTYISEERPLPAGLNERILQATLGTVTPQEIKAPWTSRAASRFRSWLDPIISPQLATVATMMLAATVVLTSTVSADGSISGVYAAGLQLAERTGAQSKSITDDPECNCRNKPPAPPAQRHKRTERISRRSRPAKSRMAMARTSGRRSRF